jgi:hypothetical protein
MIKQNAARLVGLITVALWGVAFAAKAQPTGDAARKLHPPMQLPLSFLQSKASLLTAKRRLVMEPGL